MSHLLNDRLSVDAGHSKAIRPDIERLDEINDALDRLGYRQGFAEYDLDNAAYRRCDYQFFVPFVNQVIGFAVLNGYRIDMRSGVYFVNAFSHLIQNVITHEYRYNGDDISDIGGHIFARIYERNGERDGIYVDLWGPGGTLLPDALTRNSVYTTVSLPWEGHSAPDISRDDRTTGAGMGISLMFESFEHWEQDGMAPDGKRVAVSWRQAPDGEGPYLGGNIVSVHIPLNKIADIKVNIPDVSASLPEDWRDNPLDTEEFIRGMRQINDMPESAIAEKSAMIFSEGLTFKEGLGLLLEKVARSNPNRKIAVIARTSEQKERIAGLNRGKGKDEQVMIFDSVLEAWVGLRAIKAYYFKLSDESDPDFIHYNIRIYSFNETQVRAIIESLAHASNIKEPAKVTLLREAVNRFA